MSFLYVFYSLFLLVFQKGREREKRKRKRKSANCIVIFKNKRTNKRKLSVLSIPPGRIVSIQNDELFGQFNHMEAQESSKQVLSILVIERAPSLLHLDQHDRNMAENKIKNKRNERDEHMKPTMR